MTIVTGVNMKMIESLLYKAIAKLATGNYWFDNKDYFSFPYQLWVTIDGNREDYAFRFQWFNNLMWNWALMSSNIQAGGQGIVYSNKVWRAWKLKL